MTELGGRGCQEVGRWANHRVENTFPSGPGRVCLCVSASYDVLVANVRLVEPRTPIVRMDLPNHSTASHFSEEKQQRLAQQFIDTVLALTAKGVGEIALFLAGLARLALRFGTVYDRRNLPHLPVNQFENSDPKNSRGRSGCRSPARRNRVWSCGNRPKTVSGFRAAGEVSKWVSPCGS